MLKDENREQDVKIQEMKTNICWLKKEITEIRVQVFNHLPTQARTVKDELVSQLGTVKDELLSKMQSIEEKTSHRTRVLENKILYGFVIFIASVIVTQIVISIFKWLY